VSHNSQRKGKVEEVTYLKIYLQVLTAVVLEFFSITNVTNRLSIYFLLPAEAQGFLDMSTVL